jgi:hypothetical protein
VTINSLDRILGTLILLIAYSAILARAWPRGQMQRACMQRLAASTLIVSTWGTNEVTYLAERQRRPARG